MHGGSSGRGNRPAIGPAARSRLARHSAAIADWDRQWCLTGDSIVGIAVSLWENNLAAVHIDKYVLTTVRNFVPLSLQSTLCFAHW